LAAHPDGVATWVLGKFTPEEQQFAQELVSKAAAAVALLGVRGVRAAQNRFNS
jgi:peptidyl-tRNA hydrolase